MMFQYQDEGSGEPMQCTDSSEPSLHRKIESSNRFGVLFHGIMTS